MSVSEQRTAGDESGASIRVRTLALMPCGVVLNLALGFLVYTLKLPVYLDAVGTITITLMAGVRAGVIVGITSFLLGGLLVNPVLPWFSGTQAAIAVYVHVAASRGWLRLGSNNPKCQGFSKRTVAWMRPVLTGIGLGIVAAIVSAPAIVAVFGGITGSGASLIVAFCLKSGETLVRSVLWAGLSSEPLDKTLQLILSLILIRSMPDGLKTSFGGGTLARNGLINQRS